jgi:hypothetical protein
MLKDFNKELVSKIWVVKSVVLQHRIVYYLVVSKGLGMTQFLRRTPEIIRGSRGVRDNRMNRSTLPKITTKLTVQRPRQLPSDYSPLRLLHFASFKIGRKKILHRQQLAQSKPWRETEKGRGKGKGKGRRFKMGNEESRIVDADTPPQTLKARTVEALAQYIKDGRAKQIVVMVSYASL